MGGPCLPWNEARRGRRHRRRRAISRPLCLCIVAIIFAVSCGVATGREGKKGQRPGSRGGIDNRGLEVDRSSVRKKGQASLDRRPREVSTAQPVEFQMRFKRTFEASTVNGGALAAKSGPSSGSGSKGGGSSSSSSGSKGGSSSGSTGSKGGSGSAASSKASQKEGSAQAKSSEKAGQAEEKSGQQAAKASAKSSQAAKKSSDKAAKSAKKSSDKAAKSAKKSSDKAAKSAKKSSDKAAKSAKKSSDKAAKSAKKSSDKAAKSAKKSSDKAAKSAKKSSDKAAKSAKKSSDRESKASKKRSKASEKASKGGDGGGEDIDDTRDANAAVDKQSNALGMSLCEKRFTSSASNEVCNGHGKCKIDKPERGGPRAPPPLLGKKAGKGGAKKGGAKKGGAKKGGAKKGGAKKGGAKKGGAKKGGTTGKKGGSKAKKAAAPSKGGGGGGSPKRGGGKGGKGGGSFLELGVAASKASTYKISCECDQGWSGPKCEVDMFGAKKKCSPLDASCNKPPLHQLPPCFGSPTDYGLDDPCSDPRRQFYPLVPMQPPPAPEEPYREPATAAARTD